MAYYVLAILGLIVGLFNVTDKEMVRFLVASIAFMVTFNSLSDIVSACPLGNHRLVFQPGECVYRNRQQLLLHQCLVFYQQGLNFFLFSFPFFLILKILSVSPYILLYHKLCTSPRSRPTSFYTLEELSRWGYP